MAMHATKISDTKLLLNAEAFGFGPSVAVASVFPHLRERFDHIGYVGTGHTLDVQKSLPYNDIHDLSGLSAPDVDREIEHLAREYDVFFTAMDFAMAARMKDAGLRVSSYDALTWYWPNIPEGARISDLYIAQRFFGVAKRLAEHRDLSDKSRTVAPIVPHPRPREVRDHVLINLGGLQNPLWTSGEATLYAQKIVPAIRTLLPAGEKVVVATSQTVAEALGEGSRTYAREEMQQLLASSKLAFMTPGLGNIYDAAVHDIPTVWLPPANDSQGRQLGLLEQHGMIDAATTWRDAGLPGDIDYGGTQRLVLDEITQAVHASLPSALGHALSRAYEAIDPELRSRVCALIDRFGSGGDVEVGEHLTEFAGRV